MTDYQQIQKNRTCEEIQILVHEVKYRLLLHVLLNKVTICLVTRSVIARVSEPLADYSCIDIGPLVYLYRPARVAASRWRNVR